MATNIPTPSELEAERLEPDIDALVEKCLHELRQGERTVWLFQCYSREVIDAAIQRFEEKGWSVKYEIDYEADSDHSADSLEFRSA